MTHEIDVELTATEHREESAFLNETILRKHTLEELDIVQLSKLLRRKQEIDYFIGRIEGEYCQRKYL